MKLLIIEEERELLTAIEAFLNAEGYLCETASSFREGIRKIDFHNYDCIIANRLFFDGDGLDLIKALKDKHNDTGAIIISRRVWLEDKIMVLESGADDYITKPFHFSELNARLKSLVRRRKFDGNNEVIFNEIKIATDTFRVEVHGQPVTLTKIEYELLVYFVSNKERILPKELIVNFLWPDYKTDSDTYGFIYTHVSNLRKKLMEAGARDYVRTVYGIGYKFSGRECIK